jgi:hypothetical protein
MATGISMLQPQIGLALIEQQAGAQGMNLTGVTLKYASRAGLGTAGYVKVAECARTGRVIEYQKVVYLGRRTLFSLNEALRTVAHELRHLQQAASGQLTRTAASEAQAIAAESTVLKVAEPGLMSRIGTMIFGP